MTTAEKIATAAYGLLVVGLVTVLVLTFGAAQDQTASFLACMDATDGDVWYCLNPENER